MSECLTSADFPGYAEAVARENLIRAAACLGLRETLCGVEVMPMTARHIRLLTFARSPFLLKKITVAELAERPGVANDVMGFLWVVSPKFVAGNNRKRNRFFKRIKHVGKLQFDKVAKEILDYVEDAYIDAPESVTEEKSYYAFELSIVNSLHRCWGLPVDFWEVGKLRSLIRRLTGKPNPLDVPLKIVWQNFKEQRQFINPNAVLRNASEKKLAEGLTVINQRARGVTPAQN